MNQKVLILTVAVIILFSACNQSGSAPKTKDDSLKIAKAYYKSYPEESKAIVTWSNDTTPTKFLSKEEVMDYVARYLKNPRLVNNVDTTLQGFKFSGPDFINFKSDPRLNGIYVGFATKPNGDFTLMFRGLDEKGKIILDSSSTKSGGAGEQQYSKTLEAPPPCPPTVNCPPAEE